MHPYLPLACTQLSVLYKQELWLTAAVEQAGCTNAPSADTEAQAKKKLCTCW